MTSLTEELGAADRPAARLGTALSHMAHDLATVKRENTLLRRENAALRREIERRQATPR